MKWLTTQHFIKLMRKAYYNSAAYGAENNINLDNTVMYSRHLKHSHLPAT